MNMVLVRMSRDEPRDGLFPGFPFKLVDDLLLAIIDQVAVDDAEILAAMLDVVGVAIPH